MTHRKSHGIALLVGITATVLALAFEPLLAKASVELMMKGGPIAFASAAITKVAIQAVLLTPGLLVGWIAITRGMTLALVTGVFASVIYSVALGTTLQAPAHPYLPNPWSWVVGDALTQGMLSAVAGGAARWLRSNTSLERTREG